MPMADKFVFGLDNAIAPLAGLFIHAMSLAKRLKGIHERCAGRNWIPGADGGARIKATQSRGRIAVDHDVAAGFVQRFGADRQGAIIVSLWRSYSRARSPAGSIQPRCALVLKRFLQQRFNDFHIEIEQVRPARPA